LYCHEATQATLHSCVIILLNKKPHRITKGRGVRRKRSLIVVLPPGTKKTY
jgi:hypothetical protein